MFISRQMRLALIASFIWHSACILFISVEFLPKGFKFQRYCRVNFLGPLLTGYFAVNQDTPKDDISLPPEAEINIRAARLAEDAWLSLKTDKAAIDLDPLIGQDSPEKTIPFKQGWAKNEAVSKEREIIFQPPFPRYPEWAQQEFPGSSVMFKIFISADGLVEQAINLKASADPEIDAALARYVRRWRFAPLGGASGQWQNVKLDLDRALND